ncbi:tetratricopeptide repeat protein, partial [Actinokineospora pegani]|uniref:tetratricopeptide repeat protein n=1 Tax=Actinokineospora pegani TaxID=2654637 RepID=UPI0018D3D026
MGDLPLAPGHYEDRADQVDLRTLLPRREPVTPAVTTVVLSGMGGVGKTQIAGAYARAAAEQHPPVDLRIWATATTADSIRATYARAAAKLGLTTPTTDPDEAAHLLLEWLSATTRTWLVILDDLTTPDHADGLWPPRTPTGRTLVTTRYRGADLNLAGHHTAHLEPFTPEQARHHLTTELAHHPHPCTHDDIDALTTDLGHLPLALGHATAYLHDQAITIQDYRHRLHNTPITHHPTNTRLAPIHTTLALSIPLAEHLAPGAATALLNIASLLDPNTIPDTVLTNHHIAEHLTTTPDRLHHGLRVLHRLNLLTHDPTTTTVRIHALVQRVVRETTTMTRAADPDGGTATLGRLAADALAEIWPEADTLTDIGTVLRANTTALAGHAEHHLFHPDTHPVLFRAGGSLGEQGLIAAARQHFHRLHEQTEAAHGPDHPDTLATRHNLARWRGEAGDSAGAVAAFEGLLTDALRVLGPGHPGTLATRHNLARWRGEAGDPAGAVAAYEGLLTDRLRVQGPDHPDTFATRHNLARWRGEAGDSAGAVAAFEGLLT